jgi:5'-3' exonuclease
MLIFDVPAVMQHAFWQASDQEMTIDRAIGAFVRLVNFFNDRKVFFCFDDKASYRKEALPTYKTGRVKQLEQKDEELIKRVVNMRALTTRLYDEILPEFGYSPLRQYGLEADDIIAQLCIQLEYTPKTIITTDMDLYQCINMYTNWYSPSKKEKVTFIDFRNKYQIKPSLWSLVKAIAGCHSDDIPGIVGVGEITAIKYIKNELVDCKKKRDIESEEGKNIVKFNRPLVKLPHKKTQFIDIKKPVITQKIWNQTCESLGMMNWYEEVLPITW